MLASRYRPLSVALLLFPLIAQTAESSDSWAGPAEGSAQPHLASGPGNSVVLSWLEPAGEGIALRYSTFDGHSWTSPTSVAAGDNWFINWADFPSVSPINDTTWAAHWLVKKPGSVYSYDVYASISDDAGGTWNKPFVVHNDNTATEHGFVSLFPWQGEVGVLWLDGRNTQPGDGHDSHAGGMTLRSARFSDSGVAAERVEVDGLICDCCSTDIALTANGPVAVYRDRTPEEIRDISVSRLVDGEWSRGTPVADDGWEISGCPVNGPAIDANGELASVAWFTAAKDQPAVRVASSSDSGASFAAPVDIDLDSPLGRVDIVQLADGSSIVSWLATGDERTATITVRHVGADGSLGDAIAVSSTDEGRASGFPQMIRSGDNLLFAWTDVSGDDSQVRTRLVPISNIR